MSCGEWDGAGGSRKHGNAGNVAVHVVCSNKSSDMRDQVSQNFTGQILLSLPFLLFLSLVI